MEGITPYYSMLTTMLYMNTCCYAIVNRLCILPLHRMNKGKQATIRAKFVLGYSSSLAKVRKSSKGLKTQFMFSIMLLGEYPEGLRCNEAAKISGKQQTDIFMRFSRAISAGYIRKQNKRYYLTDSGLLTYNAICKEFDSALNDILRVLIEEARGKM